MGWKNNIQKGFIKAEELNLIRDLKTMAEPLQWSFTVCSRITVSETVVMSCAVKNSRTSNVSGNVQVESDYKKPKFRKFHK